MTITINFEEWFNFLVSLPLWVKIVVPVAVWLVVGIICHRLGAPYESENDKMESAIPCFFWPFLLGLLTLFSPLLVIYFLVTIFGGKVKK